MYQEADWKLIGRAKEEMVDCHVKKHTGLRKIGQMTFFF